MTDQLAHYNTPMTVPDFRFVYTSVIAAPPEVVFGFHESPHALRELLPPWQTVEIVSGGGDLRPGAQVLLRLWAGPLWIDWLAEHTLLQRPWLFADRQVYGPFASWVHHHRFEAVSTPRGPATRLTDDITYRLPGPAWLAAYSQFLNETQLRRMFAYRHRVTRRACQTRGALAGDPPS